MCASAWSASFDQTSRWIAVHLLASEAGLIRTTRLPSTGGSVSPNRWRRTALTTSSLSPVASMLPPRLCPATISLLCAPGALSVRLDRAQRRDRRGRDRLAHGLAVEQGGAGREAAEEAAERVAEPGPQAALVHAGAAPADIDRRDVHVADARVAGAALREETGGVGRIEAQVRHVAVADPRVVPPAVDEGDHVVRAGREMLLQGVELGDDGLDHRGRHALGPHLVVHGVAEHRAVDGRVAGPLAGDQRVGLAVLLELDEAEMVGEVASAGLAGGDDVALQGAAQARRPARIRRDHGALVVAGVDPSVAVGRHRRPQGLAPGIGQDRPPCASPSRHSARLGSRSR